MRVRERDGAVGIAHADVEVDPERVVAPGDVAQRLLDDAVVGRVDDLLLPPRRPGVRAAGRERDAHRVGLVQQGAPMLDQLARRLGKRLAAPCLDLDLRRDQLARRVLAERRGVGARLELGEAVDQAERLGVDDLELLLDREGEILRAREVGTRLVERQQRVGDAQAHRREPTSALFYSRGRNLPIPVAGSLPAAVLPAPRPGLRRRLVRGLWAVPLLAFAALETAWTLASAAVVRARIPR